jgi:phage repressor protein C with HTH and peptisase S24 domain
MLFLRKIHGNSMAPTLTPGRIVVASRKWVRLNIGDIVIICHNGIEKVKRIKCQDIDKLYVTGDNSAYSTDSRQFGWLDINTVQGKVIWPRHLYATKKFRKSPSA